MWDVTSAKIIRSRHKGVFSINDQEITTIDHFLYIGSIILRDDEYLEDVIIESSYVMVVVKKFL